MEHSNKTWFIVLSGGNFTSSIVDGIGDSTKEIIECFTMKTEKVTKFFRNGKGNMSVRCVNHLA